MIHTPQSVILLDRMGDDQTVVNAARCSFGKRKESIMQKSVIYGINNKITSFINVVDKDDERLISFLAKNGHWTPFGHVQVQFHIKASMFVARQLGKHQVGIVWNEISRRYVDSEPEFYLPNKWRLRAENKKQGSSEETIDENITQYTEMCLNEYKRLLKNGIAPEMARMVLPQNTMTEWYMTGSLYAFVRLCKLRTASDSQLETREIAEMISKKCEELFPVSWKAFFNV